MSEIVAETSETEEVMEIKVLIGVPYSEKVLSLPSFYAWLRIAGGGCSIVAAEGTVCFARNEIVRKFLAGDYTHLLMLDLDHVHPADIVDRLTRWLVHESQPKVINGLHFQRRPPYQPCAFFWHDEAMLSILTMTEWKAGLVPVDATGCATMLVAREVIEAVGHPWFTHHFIGERFIGEDIWFCRRAKLAGYQVWVDTTTTSPHVGDIAATEEQFRAWQAKHPQVSERRELDLKIVEVTQ